MPLLNIMTIAFKENKIIIKVIVIVKVKQKVINDYYWLWVEKMCGERGVHVTHDSPFIVVNIIILSRRATIFSRVSVRLALRTR